MKSKVVEKSQTSFKKRKKEWSRKLYENDFKDYPDNYVDESFLNLRKINGINYYY
jgi:predicted RNA-binding protein